MMFLILAALMMVMAANDWMLTNMVGALAFAMVVGTCWAGWAITSPSGRPGSAAACSSACLVAGALQYLQSHR
ncbi:MAG: hypothetical protein ACLUVA_09225 [Faecalibacterium sp.]